MCNGRGMFRVQKSTNTNKTIIAAVEAIAWNKRNNDSNQISSQPPDPPLLSSLIEAKQAFHHSPPFPMNIDLVINRKTTADMMAPA